MTRGLLSRRCRRSAARPLRRIGAAALAFAVAGLWSTPFATASVGGPVARQAASPGVAAPVELAQKRRSDAIGSAAKAPPRGSSAELYGGSSADRYGGSSADRGGVAGPRDRRVHQGFHSRERGSRGNPNPGEAPEEGEATEER